MQNKLRAINFTISDLAYFLNISRPTLYKLIEMFNKEDFESIPTKILLLFRYIQNEQFLTKQKLIKFLLFNINNQNDDAKNSVVSNKLNSNDKSKFELINLINESKQINFFIVNLSKLIKLIDSSTDLSLKDIEFVNELIETICIRIEKKRETKNGK